MVAARSPTQGTFRKDFRRERQRVGTREEANISIHVGKPTSTALDELRAGARSSGSRNVQLRSSGVT